MIDDTVTVTLLIDVLVGLVLVARWRLPDAGQRHAGARDAAVPPVPRPAVSLRWGAISRPIYASDPDVAIDVLLDQCGYHDHRGSRA